MSRQRQLENKNKIIMADVEPGEKTGIYYMPICNLPFGTSWQDFKDWLRVDCDVEHVELFQSSTSGWIRLRGEENFNKAWSRLKKEYFRNRAIIASDKNRRESIKIKEVVDSRVAKKSTTRVRWEVAATPAHDADAILSPASSGIQEAVTLGGPLHQAYHALGAARSHTFSYVPAFGYYGLPTPNASGPMPAAHFNNRLLYGAAQLPLDAQYLRPHQRHLFIPCGSTPGILTNAAPTAPAFYHQGSYTLEQACKVVVMSIQYKSRPSEVSSWIRHQVGEYSSAIMGIDIPVVESRGRLRGHAHVILANSMAAEATARILDQKLFRGRVVSARQLGAEASAESERSRAKSKSSYGEPRAQHACRPVRMDEGEEDGTLVETNRVVAGPVIANGSSAFRPEKS